MSRVFTGNAADKLEATYPAFGQPLTLFAWVKRDNWISPRNYIIEAGIPGSNNFRISVGGANSNNALEYGVRDTSGSFQTLTSNADEYDGLWVPVMGRFDAGTAFAKCYWEARTNQQTTNKLLSTLTTILLGSRHDNSSPLTGKIAHAAVWDISLTDADYANLFNGGAAGNGVNPSTIEQANLVGYWPLTTASLADQSGNAGPSLVLSGTVAFDGADNPPVDSAGSVPADPTALSATGAVGQIDLAWTDNATDEDNYTVERSADGSTGWSVLTSTLPPDTEAYSDTAVNELETWFYRVKATNATGDSGYSNVDSATVPATQPLAPTLLSATPNGAQIDLAWTDNATNEVNYVVERSTDGGAFVDVSDLLPADTVVYNDTDVVQGPVYTYRCYCVNSAAQSDYSNEDSASLAESTPAAPTDLSAGDVNDDAAGLQWTDNATNEENYRVDISTAGPGGPWTQEGGLYPPDTIQALVTGLDPETDYWFRVAAINTAGESVSNVVAVTTLPVSFIVGSALFRMTGFGHTHDRDFEMTGIVAGNIKRLKAGVWVDATAYRLKGGVWTQATVKRLKSGSWQ